MSKEKFIRRAVTATVAGALGLLPGAVNAQSNEAVNAAFSNHRITASVGCDKGNLRIIISGSGFDSDFLIRANQFSLTYQVDTDPTTPRFVSTVQSAGAFSFIADEQIAPVAVDQPATFGVSKEAVNANQMVTEAAPVASLHVSGCSSENPNATPEHVTLAQYNSALMCGDGTRAGKPGDELFVYHQKITNSTFANSIKVGEGSREDAGFTPTGRLCTDSIAAPIPPVTPDPILKS